MPNCDPCIVDGYSVGSAGFCQHANHAGNWWVCQYPNKTRPDHVFHGERCGCGCGQLLCQRHILAHRRTNHPTKPSTANCFPRLGMVIAGPALSGAGTLLVERRALESDEVKRAEHSVSEYLTMMELDRATLSQATDWVDDSYREDDGWVLKSPFFSDARLERAAVLAAYTVGRSWPDARDVTLVCFPRSAKSEASLAALARWATEKKPLTTSDLAQALSIFSPIPERVSWVEVADRIRAAMKFVDLPDANTTIEAWFALVTDNDEMPA